MKDKKEQPEKFVVEYEYFGLSTAAEVTRVQWLSGVCYRCSLKFFELPVEIGFRNEDNSGGWIDVNIDKPTPLAQILGQAIENKMGNAHS